MGDRVSVAMTTYNSGPYLIPQLNSLRDQTLPFDEVVIVDDSSANGTVDVIRNYISKNNLEHWRLIVNHENRGYIKSFQTALASCHGDIIFLCDHDDQWKLNKVETMVNIMNQDFDIGCLLCSFNKIDGDNNRLPVVSSNKVSNNGLIRRKLRKKGGLNRLDFNDVLAFNVGPGCTLAIRKELSQLYLRLGEGNTLPHDWALASLAAVNDKLFYIDLPLINYRLYDANTLGLEKARNWEERRKRAAKDFKDKEENYKLLMSYNNCPKVYRKRIKRIKDFYQKRNIAINKKNILAFIPLLLQSVRWRGVYKTIGMDILSILGSCELTF